MPSRMAPSMTDSASQVSVISLRSTGPFASTPCALRADATAVFTNFENTGQAACCCKIAFRKQRFDPGKSPVRVFAAARGRGRGCLGLLGSDREADASWGSCGATTEDVLAAALPFALPEDEPAAALSFAVPESGSGCTRCLIQRNQTRKFNDRQLAYCVAKNLASASASSGSEADSANVIRRERKSSDTVSRTRRVTARTRVMLFVSSTLTICSAF